MIWREFGGFAEIGRDSRTRLGRTRGQDALFGRYFLAAVILSDELACVRRFRRDRRRQIGRGSGGCDLDETRCLDIICWSRWCQRRRMWLQRVHGLDEKYRYLWTWQYTNVLLRTNATNVSHGEGVKDGKRGDKLTLAIFFHQAVLYTPSDALTKGYSWRRLERWVLRASAGTPEFKLTDGLILKAQWHIKSTWLFLWRDRARPHNLTVKSMLLLCARVGCRVGCLYLLYNHNNYRAYAYRILISGNSMARSRLSSTISRLWYTGM